MQILAQLLAAHPINSGGFSWTDAYVVAGQPISYASPSGNRQVIDSPVSEADIHELVKSLTSKALSEGNADAQADLDAGALKVADEIESMNDSSQGIRLRFTVSKAMVPGGFQITVRPVPLKPPTIDGLQVAIPLLREMVQSSGIILVTGPTRNGKSTLLAALVEEARTCGAYGHIVKVEDPIEFIHPSSNRCIVTPREIGKHVRSYETAAQDALRMGPGAIAFGEIRDAESAIATINVGEAGHMVMATMQSTTVEGAYNKLMVLTAEHRGAKDAINGALRAIIRTCLVPSMDGLSFHLGYEYVTASDPSEGIFGRGGPDDFRASHMAGNYANSAKTLNESLLKLVREGKVSETAAMMASNEKQRLRELLSPTSSGVRMRN